MTLPNKYYWGPLFKRPLLLNLNAIENSYTFPKGKYDIATLPIGDNWAINPIGLKFTTIELKKPGSFSLLPKFPFDEQSCGFLWLIRGPYTDEQNKPDWQINSPPNGMCFGRLSLPIFTHSGSRFSRYQYNGYPWNGLGNYLPLSSSFWATNPMGPKKLDGTREPIKHGEAPDVSILSSVTKGKVWAGITKVDMFGRESEMSPLLEVNIQDDYGAYIKLGRTWDVEVGVCGFYIYLGKETTTGKPLPGQMHRQPILNYQGKASEYLWPIFLQQFVLHDIIESNIRYVPPPTYGVASIIPQPLKDVVDGKMIIEATGDYDLYCPFMLPWEGVKFGRIVGSENKKITLTQKKNYGDAQLVTNYPLLYIQNQKDTVRNIVFRGENAIAGVTFSDFSGGQAFDNTLQNCEFELNGAESYGFLVDELCSIEWGKHTVSETQIKGCKFRATIPVKTEGLQTAKIRFTEHNSFISNDLTRYPADTAAIYHCSSNDLDVIDVEGFQGKFRSLVCNGSNFGPPVTTIGEFFVDQGCSVYATFCSYNGGIVKFLDGERINSNFQKWVRLAEAPITLMAEVISKGVRIDTRASSISFQLNQLSLDLDFYSEIVCPDTSFWLSKGIGVEYASPGNPAYYNFGTKKNKYFRANYLDCPNSIPIILPNSGLTPVVS